MVCREINSNSTPMSPFSQNEQYQPISYNLPYPWRLVLKVQSLRPVVGLEELGHARKILLRDRRETKLQRERRKHTIARQSFILWLWECLETFVLQFLSVLALLFNALVMTGHSLRAMTSLADIRGSASFFLKISKKVSPYIHLPDPPPPPPLPPSQCEKEIVRDLHFVLRPLRSFVYPGYQRFFLAPRKKNLWHPG